MASAQKTTTSAGRHEFLTKDTDTSKKPDARPHARSRYLHYQLWRANGGGGAPSFPTRGKGGPSAERSEEPMVERESCELSAGRSPSPPFPLRGMVPLSRCA